VPVLSQKEWSGRVDEEREPSDWVYDEEVDIWICSRLQVAIEGPLFRRMIATGMNEPGQPDSPGGASAKLDAPSEEI